MRYYLGGRVFTRPKRLSEPAYHQLVEFFESRCDADSRTRHERWRLVFGLEERAYLHRPHLDRLPRGIRLVVSPGMEYRGNPYVHTIDWGDNPVDMPPIEFHDPAIAVAVAWTLFTLQRPLAIDDARLRVLVEDAPVARSRLVGLLLSVRFADLLSNATSRMLRACFGAHAPDPQTADVHGALTRVETQYRLRCGLAVHELSRLLGVEEPEMDLRYEVQRWRWMLHDYVQALAPRLHEHLEALGRRFEDARDLDNPREIWDEICDGRQLDTCAGLLLARAAMLDPQSNRDPLRDFMDPLVSRSPFSLAWWCYAVMEAVEAELSFGERLPASLVEKFVGLARTGIEHVDAELLDALYEAFPSLGRRVS